MPLDHFSEEAKRVVTARCLIAADIDQTLLFTGADRERQHFLENVAPELLRAASLGVNLAFLTGNSMHELSSRFLRWLVEQLSHTGRLELLDRFHFFCNAAGVYAHFPLSDKALKGAISSPRPSGKLDRILRVLTATDDKKKLAIRSRFIDAPYIERSSIPEHEAKMILTVLEEVGQKYLHHLIGKKSSYERIYDLSQVSEGSDFRVPRVDSRVVHYGSDTCARKATVQITLKPILSFRHAYKPSQCFGKDLRVKAIEQVQKGLDNIGLGHYVARPGGLSSIDVTLEKLDKAYALEFLIDRLNVRGYSRSGQKFGSNTIYIGDEVIVGGGNDYPVTRIPGLLAFAVNPDQQFIPFLSHVFVPSAILVGPDATSEILGQFNKCAVRLLNEFNHLIKKKAKIPTALEALKEEIFVNRIREKIASLRDTDRTSVEDWQTLHAFVTLICRDDPAAGRWLSILINELDAIMTQLKAGTPLAQPAQETTRQP